VSYGGGILPSCGLAKFAKCSPEDAATEQTVVGLRDSSLSTCSGDASKSTIGANCLRCDLHETSSLCVHVRVLLHVRFFTGSVFIGALALVILLKV